MITKELFDEIFPTDGLSRAKYNLVRERDALIRALNKFLPLYGITTYLRFTAFLATCGIETDYFKTSREYASGADYEGRTDLGNVRDGDGRRFPGRSVIQTTGRYNYWRVVCRFIKKLTGRDFTKDERKYENFDAYLASTDYEEMLKVADELDVNFLANPEKLESVEIAVEAACIFWEENKLNAYADRGEFKALNGIVNKGSAKATPLHWSKRNELYSLCKRRVPKDFSFKTISTLVPPAAPVAAAPEPAASQIDQNSQANAQTVEPSVSAGATDFLNAALDRNVTPDAVKTAVPTFGARLWRFLIRPLTLLYGALEAGNVAAWLGMVVFVAVVIYLGFLHRNDLKKLLNTLKAKYLQ